MDFEDFESLELGARRPPASYAYTAPPLKQKQKSAPKLRRRETRRKERQQLTDLDSYETALVTAQMGVDPEQLPPHLRVYALQRRNEACFSGPGVLPGEQEAGRVEYKLRLLNPTPARFQQLVTQLKWRLSEGGGECLYALGVEDNGHPRGLDERELDASLGVLRSMAAEVGAQAEVLQMPPGSGAGLRCAVVRVVRGAAPTAARYVDLRVAVAGGIDSGKSSLVGVLCNGAGGAPALDNGRGSSRTAVLRHKHEILSGHTSSISAQQCAYDREGRVLNYCGVPAPAAEELAAAAARMVRFFDLGGHERYSKTMLHGLTTLLPDCVLLCVSAAAGMSWVSREHLAVALALGIPLAVAITKSDLAPEGAVQQAAEEIRDLLAAAVQQGGGTASDPEALAPLVQSAEQAAQLAAAAHRSRVAAPGASLCVPLFATSAVTGASLQLVHSFLNALQPAGGSEGMQGWCQPALRGPESSADAGKASPRAAHFQIDSSFEVADVGTVYSGTVVSGSICLGDELLLGPLEGGSFRRVAVSGIHRSRVEVQQAQQGQQATLAVKPLDASAADAAAADAAGSEAAAAEEPVAAPCSAPAPGQPPLAQPPPLRTDSAGCLRAWMQQTCSGPAEAGPARALPPSTPALAIQGRPIGDSHAALTTSHSAAQLGGSLRMLGSSGELRHAWGSSPQLGSAGSGAAPRPRKGAVLLSPSLQPQAASRFEAVLVLLGGHWPARGLLSGRYPPEGEADQPDPDLEADVRPSSSLGALGTSPTGAASDGGGSFGGRASSLGRLQRSSSRRRGGAYIPVIHCGSIRQAAQVVAMRELPHSCGCRDLGGLGDLDLLGFGSGSSEAGDGEEGEESDPLAALMGADLFAEPSGNCSCCAGAGTSTEAAPAGQPDLCRLAGAMAAAGVLLPQQLAGSGGSGCPLLMHTASSGSTSGCEGGGGTAAGYGAQPERQRSPLPSSDIGCLAAVTFTFMHQPEWLVEGARLIARDRSTGRVAAAGYVSAVCPLSLASQSGAS